MNEECDDFADDESDDPTFNLQDDASDVETNPSIENCEEDTSDDDDELPPNEATISDTIYFGKNSMKWDKAPPPTSRVRAYNVFNIRARRPGPLMQTHDPLAVFKTIFTVEMSQIIIRETNCKASKIIEEWNEANPQRPKERTPVTIQELEAFLAVLLHSGLTKSNNEPAYCIINSALHKHCTRSAQQTNGNLGL